jgi:SSS family solute:Na+ symporter
VWNDCIQFVVYIAGALLALALIVAFLGARSTEPAELLGNLPRGWEHLTEYARQHGKFRLFDFTWDVTRPYTFWSGLFGGVFVALATHGTDQLMVQRYLSARSLKGAGRALALSGFVVCGQFALFLLIGVALACFYQLFPPEQPFGSNDQVFSAFVVRYLPVGAVGLIVAAVFSAAMSTLSSSLNSSAASAVNDLYLPWRKTGASPRHLLWVSRGLTVAFGVVQIGIGIAGQVLVNNVVEGVMAIATFTIGVILGVFFLGVLTKHVTQAAALIGLLVGLAAMGAIVFLTELAWPWYAIVGSSITFAAGCAAAALLPAGARRPEPVDRRT